MNWCWFAKLPEPVDGALACATATDVEGIAVGALAAWPPGRKPVADAVRMDARLLDPAGDPAWISLILLPRQRLPLFDDPAVSGALRAVLVGMGGDTVPLPLAHVQNFEIEVTGTFRYANTWPTATALAASGEVDLARLVTHRYGLEDSVAALTVSAADPTAIKAVVRPRPE